MKALIATVLCSGAMLSAQALPPSSQGGIPQFSSRVQLVEVYATVTDAAGQPVTGLRQSDFEVYEDKIERRSRAPLNGWTRGARRHCTTP